MKGCGENFEGKRYELRKRGSGEGEKGSGEGEKEGGDEEKGGGGRG